MQVATTAAAQNNLADKLKSSDVGDQLTTNLKSEAGTHHSPFTRDTTRIFRFPPLEQPAARLEVVKKMRDVHWL